MTKPYFPGRTHIYIFEGHLCIPILIIPLNILNFYYNFFFKFWLSKWLISLGEWGLHTQGWEALGGDVCPWVFHHDLCQTKNRIFPDWCSVCSVFHYGHKERYKIPYIKKSTLYSCFAVWWRLENLNFIYFPLSIFPVLFCHQPLMLIIFNHLLLSPFPQ